MADIRIKDLATTASVTASDDFMAVDGTTNGTRKLSAATPSFATSVTTPSLTSPASTNLTLGLGTGGTALTLASSTLAATFAGTLTTAGDITAGDNTHLGRLNVNDSTGGLGEVLIYGNVLKMSARTAGGSLGFRVNGDNSTVLDIASTGAATFAGAVTIATGAAVGGATAGAGGLAFPATAVAVANANTLDDYEEGTWTPTVAGSTTAGTVAYSSRNGYYTKIGRLLYVWFDLEVSSFSGGVGGLTITNLPFPNANITNFYPTFQPWYVASAYAQTYTTPTGSINPNTSVLILYSTDDGHANFASMNVNQTGRIAGYLMMQTT